MPQPPQLAGSLAPLTVQPPDALPLQLRKPLLQDDKQVDEAQAATELAGTAQTLPQAPQLLGSKRGSTHAPAQATSGVAQLATHLPEEHSWPAPHAEPHAPQLAGSPIRLVQKADAPLPHAFGVALGHWHVELTQS